MRGCVWVEPDGTSHAQPRDTLAAIAGQAEVVGPGLLEVDPTLDIGTAITSYPAAHTLSGFPGNTCAQPRWRQRRAARA